MALIRREQKRKKQSVLVRFQPWLIAGGIILNAIATASAAISAYYSSEQSELARASVNQQSLNQAFSDYLKAKEALCKVSMTQFDQMDSIDADLPNPKANALVLDADYDEIMQSHTGEKVEAFISQSEKAVADLNSKFQQLSIWLDGPLLDFIYSTQPSGDGESYNPNYLRDSKIPAEFQVVLDQYRCRRQMSAALVLFKNPNATEKDIGNLGAAYVRPISKVRTTESIVNEWGDQMLIDELRRQGGFEIDKQSKRADAQ